MAMFGSGFRPSMAVSPMDLPPGSPAPAGTMQPAPAAAPAAPKRRGLFGRIGNALFSNPDVLVNLGANIMAASGAPLGQAILGTQQQAREDEELDILREYRRAQASKLAQPQQSNAARMASELGLAPGTAEYKSFIRRYAFKPTILQVPNATGGIDYTQVDMSGDDEPASSGLTAGHVEDGYRFNGGDPADPSSWSKL